MREYRTKICNVLIIGSGGAGLRAAIAAHENGCEVMVIGKRIRNDAHTTLAAGGINAALGTVDPDDNWVQHFVDTYQEGYHIGDPKTVEILVKDAPNRVEELVDWGAPFARTADGKLDQRYFGAHTFRRTCYAGDYTGRAILNTLVEKVEQLQIPIIDMTYVSRLLVNTQNGQKQCFGAMAFDINSGERTVFLSDSVVLAAGGHTRIWRRSSSRRDENTGDAMRLALNAGCRLSDMEMVQFHPTGMVHPESLAGTLVTEAVRGEGGRLTNSNGERYMEKYDSVRMELSTRDRVALANYTEISEGRGTENNGVYLDISHVDKGIILEKLPRMYRQFMESQMLDISKHPMEVAPTAHYSMGGVMVDPETHSTGVNGLYAAGECTSGVHGANRLGGNSLAEILVFGKIAGDEASEFSKTLDLQTRNRSVIQDAIEELDKLTTNGEQLARPLQRAVRDIMWEYCGVLRSGDGLEKGLEELMKVKEASADVDVRPSAEGFSDLALALDLLGSIDSAEATIRSAIERKESRGAHQRSDFVETDTNETVNYVVELVDGKQVLTRSTVAPLSDELEGPVKAYQELSVGGRLLE
ncbi:MAG: succinate dehydrogenase [Euryarchaeota archaeon]|nr:succinate dehydrogenase [Euryarchaeota archaeon]|tara:strand:+ start:147 stop:1901 length:1755 start_codon:yes stop_codon:yes gene_type:complete